QEKGDYELGASLLDDRDPQHVKLKHELIEAQRERDARQSRIQSLKRLAVGLVISFCVMGTFAFREIVDQRNTAETERQNALTAAQRAHEAAEDALTAESAAKTAKAEAEAEMHAAMVARASEARARQEEAHAHREA